MLLLEKSLLWYEQLKSLLHFNRIPEIKGVGKDTISSPLSFCPICNNPRKDSDLLSLESHESCQSSRFAAAAAACSSCCFQILLKGALNNGTFLFVFTPTFGIPGEEWQMKSLIWILNH